MPPMMCHRLVQSMVVTVFALVAMTCLSHAEDIKVGVISAKTGRPLVEAHTQLFINGRANAADPMFNRWQYTDNEGIAVFHVPDPIPMDTRISVGGAGDWCSPAI